MEAPVRNAAEIADAIDAFAREPNGGLIVHPHPVIAAGQGRLIIKLAAQRALPAMYPYVGYVERGGLICYGIDWIERWRSMAGYVDLILRGARPADLPVQSATKIQLAINLPTAKALGLAVPARLLARADRVFE
jgi:putative ABC transport system substrate-binding protein